MKVGIIGAQGFVGSAFFDVWSADKKNTVVAIGKGDYGSMVGSEFDILINANGNSSKPLADKDPAKDFEMNVANTIKFLQDFKCGHYIHISTVEVYNDKSKPDATREDAQIEPSRLSNYGFSKYSGELVAKKHAKSWMILRLAGMVGKNMKKGPAHDIMNLKKLFISEKSELQFIETREVARIALELAQKGRWGQIYNVVGKGNIKLSEFAAMASVRLASTGSDELKFDVSTQKIENEIRDCPTTLETIARFVKQG